MAGRKDDDSFIKACQKRNPKFTDSSLHRMETKSRSQDIAPHVHLDKCHHWEFKRCSQYSYPKEKISDSLGTYFGYSEAYGFGEEF